MGKRSTVATPDPRRHAARDETGRFRARAPETPTGEPAPGPVPDGTPDRTPPAPAGAPDGNPDGKSGETGKSGWVERGRLLKGARDVAVLIWKGERRRDG